MTRQVDSNKAIFNIKPATNNITLANYWDHFLARLGVRRNKHLINPGLYALGSPTKDSPVFVTANYTLSFDALRSALTGMDCYILVLDTKGINVWCAAGKGTFGTDELVNRIEETSLSKIINNKKLILPQLGATGVSAFEVKKRSGFIIEYGPIRARDLPEYLFTHKATPEMRRVNFNLRDRLTLIPVEVVSILLPTLIIAAILYFTSGLLTSIATITAIIAGVILFPILLPWIPTPNFSTKGFLLGGIVVLPFILEILLRSSNASLWHRTSVALSYLLTLPPVTAFLSLNFTGSTTFTSRSGVKREIYTYIPIMAWMFGGGLVFSVILLLVNKL